MPRRGYLGMVRRSGATTDEASGANDPSWSAGATLRQARGRAVPRGPGDRQHRRAWRPRLGSLAKGRHRQRPRMAHSLACALPTADTADALGTSAGQQRLGYAAQRSCRSGGPAPASPIRGGEPTRAGQARTDPRSLFGHRRYAPHGAGRGAWRLGRVRILSRPSRHGTCYIETASTALAARHVRYVHTSRRWCDASSGSQQRRLDAIQAPQPRFLRRYASASKCWCDPRS